MRALNRARRSAQQTASASAAIQPKRGALQRPEKQDQRRRGPEGDIVAERVELGPELALRPQQAGNAPVKPVEDACQNDAPSACSHSPLIAKRTPVRPKHKRQRGDRVGHHGPEGNAPRLPLVGHWLIPVSAASTPISPRIVSPAIVRWPSSTSRPVPAGR